MRETVFVILNASTGLYLRRGSSLRKIIWAADAVEFELYSRESLAVAVAEKVQEKTKDKIKVVRCELSRDA